MLDGGETVEIAWGELRGRERDSMLDSEALTQRSLLHKTKLCFCVKHPLCVKVSVELKK